MTERPSDQQLIALLQTAASINRDYLRLIPDRENNPTENYIDRFQNAANGLAVRTQ